MGIGPREIIVILLVVLLLFGARRLGDIGKGLGQGIRNFKKGLSESESDAQDEGEAGAPEGEDDEEPKQLAGKALTDKQSARKKQGKV
jgi:sec-independent protein translocase protein TatA